MKRRIIVFTYILLGFEIFAKPVLVNNAGFSKFGKFSKAPYYCSLYKDDSNFVLYRKDYSEFLDGGAFQFSFDLNSVSKKYDAYGFPYYEIPDSNLCLFFAGNRFIYMDNSYVYKNDTGKSVSQWFSESSKFPGYTYLTNIYDPLMIEDLTKNCNPRFLYINNGVRLSCNSNLRDSSHVYNINNISLNFVTDSNGESLLWNSKTVPWVEAESGSGIGVEITIDFVPNEYSLHEEYELGMCKSFVIMNGYVDFFRRDLFKKNNRVKKLRVQSNDYLDSFDFVVELEDTPEFQEIKLPRYSKSVKITIVDVYKGTHYDDTCLTGIMTCGKNYAPYDFTLKDVENYLGTEGLDWNLRKGIVVDEVFPRDGYH